MSAYGGFELATSFVKKISYKWLKIEIFKQCNFVSSLCLTFLSSVFRLFFCCFYSLYSLLFWPYFSSYCLSDPTFPFLLLLYSLYSLLFWPYFSFSSAAARKVKQRHKTAFLSRFHQKVEEIHFKLEKTVKNRYSWLIWSTRFARTSKRHL